MLLRPGTENQMRSPDAYIPALFPDGIPPELID